MYMLENMFFMVYFIFINILSGIVFSFDKFMSIKQKSRISEFKLHLLELFGGLFSILILRTLINHKSSKKKYYLITYLIGILWVFILFNFL